MNQRHDNPDLRRTFRAVGTASALLLLVGAGFRSIDETLSRALQSDISTPEISQLPMTLDDWRGRDEPLSAALVRAAGVEAYVHRAYTSRRDNARVLLFIGYGVRPRDLAPHRPDVCYPGAGWRLESERRADVPLPDGTNLPCCIYRFSRGGFASDEITVLNYYRIDGRNYPDVGYLRANAWSSARVRYVAQVQIACADVAADMAERLVRQFARQGAGHIAGSLPQVSEISP